MPNYSHAYFKTNCKRLRMHSNTQSNFAILFGFQLLPRPDMIFTRWTSKRLRKLRSFPAHRETHLLPTLVFCAAHAWLLSECCLSCSTRIHWFRNVASGNTNSRAPKRASWARGLRGATLRKVSRRTAATFAGSDSQFDGSERQ